MTTGTQGTRRRDAGAPSGARRATGASRLPADRPRIRLRMRLRVRVRRPGPYLLFGAGFWLMVSVVVWHTPIASDFGQHAAAVEQVRQNWRHPANPLLAADGAGSPYYSPYVVGLGLAAKATGVAGWVALRWCGVLDVAVLVAGVGAYARTLSPRPLAPVWALTAFSLLWGLRGTEWSGFCGLWSLTRGAAYPSTFAVGLTFLLWAWTDRLVRRGRPGRRETRDVLTGREAPGGRDVPGGRGGGWVEHAALGAAGAVLLLIHPITALAATVGVAATVAARRPERSRDGGRRRRGDGRRRGGGFRTWPRTWPRISPWCLPRSGREGARWGLTAAVAVGAAAAWPYFDVFALAGDGTLDAVHRTLYEQPLRWYALAAAGLPALVWRARTAPRPGDGVRAGDVPAAYDEGRARGRGRARWSVRDPLLLMFAAYCVIAAYGWASGHYTYGRVFALLLVPPQFALAVELAELPRWTRLRAVLTPLTAVALCCGLVAQIGAVVPRRVLPVALDHPLRFHDYRWAADRMRTGDVVLTDSYQATHVLPAYGVRLVAPTWPDPSVPAAERDRRFADLVAYLRTGTPGAARTAIARRYHVRWLLLTQDEHVPYDGVLVDWDVPTHERLIRLDPP